MGSPRLSENWVSALAPFGERCLWCPKTVVTISSLNGTLINFHSCTNLHAMRLHVSLASWAPHAPGDDTPTSITQPVSETPTCITHQLGAACGWWVRHLRVSASWSPKRQLGLAASAKTAQKPFQISGRGQLGLATSAKPPKNLSE